jgi:hypothetical protein
MIAALERDGRRRLVLYRFDGGQWAPLLDDRADWPTWNTQSTAILFRAGDVLNDINVKTKRTEKIVALKNEQVGGFTHAIGRTDDNAPTRTLNRDGRQVYDLRLQDR